MKKSIWDFGVHFIIIVAMSIINIILGNEIIAIYLLSMLIVGEIYKVNYLPK